MSSSVLGKGSDITTNFDINCYSKNYFSIFLICFKEKGRGFAQVVLID